MKWIISPAKNMKTVMETGAAPQKPLFLDRADVLREILKEYSAWQLEQLLCVNPNLGMQAFFQYQGYDPQKPGTPAVLTYRGLQYQSMKPEEFTPEDLTFAQNGRMFILSALYGLLRPLDGIQPYRLEMQSKLKINGGNLYRYWGDFCYRELFQDGEPVVNLASAEYAKMVAPWLKPSDRMITCNFYTYSRGKMKMLPTSAKMARGQMARYCVKGRIEDPEGLKSFSWEGYRFVPELSNKSTFTYFQDIYGL